MQRTFSVVLLSLLLLSPVPLAAADTDEAAAPEQYRVHLQEFFGRVEKGEYELLKMKLIFPTTPDESRDTTHRQALTTTLDGLGLGSSP